MFPVAGVFEEHLVAMFLASKWKMVAYTLRWTRDCNPFLVGTSPQDLYDGFPSVAAANEILSIPEQVESPSVLLLAIWNWVTGFVGS